MGCRAKDDRSNGKDYRGVPRKRKKELNPLHYNLLALFKVELESENQSPHSIYTALYRLTKYFKFLQQIGKTVETANGMDIKMFLASIQNPVTRHRVGAVLKRFYRFLYENMDEKYKRIYESFKATPPRQYPTPQLPEDSEVQLLINYAVQPHKSIIALAYECALRRSEILLLRIGDIEDYGDYIKITVRRSKSKPRTVLLIKYKHILREWLKKHPTKNDPQAFVFFSKTHGVYKPMSTGTLYNYLMKLKRKLKLKTRIYLHLFRHKRATELYKELKEKEMMEYFGWTTRTMIDIYAQIVERDVHEKILTLYGIKPKPPSPREALEIEEAKQLIDRLLELALENPGLLRSLLDRATTQ